MALALGSTVGELQERMGYDEFTHWAAFYHIESWGEWRADLRTADTLALLANVNRDPKKQKAFKAKDFMRDWWGEQAPQADKPQDAQTLLEKFRALTTQPGGG